MVPPCSHSVAPFGPFVGSEGRLEGPGGEFDFPDPAPSPMDELVNSLRAELAEARRQISGLRAEVESLRRSLSESTGR